MLARPLTASFRGRGGCRRLQLRKHLSDPTHPFHKFSTGNLETLGNAPKSKGQDVRDMVEALEIQVPLVKTTDNWADFFTKPLKDKEFFALRALIMNEQPAHRQPVARDTYM